MKHCGSSARHIAVAALSVVVSIGAASAEDWRSQVDALRPKNLAFGEAAVLENLERRAHAALAAIPRSPTAADAERRRGPLRRELERSVGVEWLPWPPALRPRVVGTLRYNGYRIEKLVYESLPGMLVPAHLYLPGGVERPAPAVLFYPGHWWPDSKSRPDFQAFCINMARLGFVVLSFDPFGQGERGVSSRDHRRTEALLVGVAQQGFAVYETRCALEYLLSMIEAVRRLARDLPPSPAHVELRSVLGPMPSAAPARIRLSDAVIQRVLVPSEPGLDVPAFLLRPAGEVRGVVVALDDRGKEALASDPVMETARARGWAICGVDPRGIGESATDKMGWVFAVSLLLGENFVGRQAWDLGRVLEALGAAGGFQGKPVGLYARGQVACLAATYAIARASEPGQIPLRWYVLRDGFLSYRAWIDRPRSMPESYRLLPKDRDRATAFDREIPASFFAFNALRSFDLPQLLSMSRTEALIVNPVDGDRERLPEKVARALLPQRARVICADEPGQTVGEFLGAVLGQMKGLSDGSATVP